MTNCSLRRAAIEKRNENDDFCTCFTIRFSLTPIIILNWNGIDDTTECINSVLQLENSVFHIYLVDNASDNNEGDQLESLYADSDNITVIQNTENLGFTGAHIRIWEEVFANQKDLEFITLLNNDTTVDSNWLTALLSEAHLKKADIVSSKMIQYYERSKMDNAGHKMINTGEILPIGHGDPIENYDSDLENIGACAGACLYRASMIKQIDFFDPEFTTGYEDAEFGLRATIAGYKSVYSPKAIVYHKMGQSVKKIFNETYALMIQTSILYSYFKLMPRMRILLDIPSFIFKFLSMLIIDILFLRFGYLRILFKSWISVWNKRSIIKSSRAKFYDKGLPYLSSSQIRSKIEFFLWFDIKRFWNGIILNRDNSLDQYGSEAESPNT